MKQPQTKRSGVAGFSLIELMIAAACASLVAGACFGVQLASLNLFRTNGSVNVGQEGTRKIFDRLEKEIQSAISIPALVSTNRDILNSVGPAPGVAFLRQTGPLRKIAARIAAGSKVVVLDSTGPAPVVGQRLLLPSYDIEGDIISVAGNTVALAEAVPIDVEITNALGDRNVVAVLTDIVTYVVVNSDPLPGAPFKKGELREYQNASTNAYNLVATGLTAPNPFGLPYNAAP